MGTKTKTCIIYHRIDLDGWMSAAIVKKWFIRNHLNWGVLRNNSEGVTLIDYDSNIEDGPVDSLDFIGWNYGDEIPNLGEYDKIIMCDVSFSKEEMVKIAETFGLNFTWIDHHISAINKFHSSDVDGYYPEGIRNVNFSACELTWKHFFPQQKMPEIVRLLGRYDTFQHIGTSEEDKVLMFQYGARSAIKNYQEAYSELHKTENKDIGSMVLDGILKNGSVIYKYLSKEAQSLLKLGIDIMIPLVSESGGELKFRAINHPSLNPQSFDVSDYKDYDGFMVYRNNVKGWTVTVYKNHNNIDCSKIAERFGGGGHKGAAGFPVEDIYSFIEIYRNN